MTTSSANQIQSKPECKHRQSRSIRTFLIHDCPSMLATIKQIVAKHDRVAIIGWVTDSRTAFEAASMSYADLVVMDVEMHGLDSAEITRWLKQLQNPPAVFIVASHDTPNARARSRAAGADAFLDFSNNLEGELLTNIQRLFGDHAANQNGR